MFRCQQDNPSLHLTIKIILFPRGHNSDIYGLWIQPEYGNIKHEKRGAALDNSLISSTAYDDVFRTLLNDCSKLVIPLINEAFGETYTGNEEIRFSGHS